MILLRADKLYRGMNYKGGENMQNGYRWLIAGTMLGVAGVYMGMSLSRNSNMSMKKIRNKAARMTSRGSKAAGDFISSAGDSLANRMS
jgi:hypothetical protein